MSDKTPYLLPGDQASIAMGELKRARTRRDRYHLSVAWFGLEETNSAFGGPPPEAPTPEWDTP